MEKQTITIGNAVRLIQQDGWYIIEEHNIKAVPEPQWEELARFKLGFDAITYLKGYMDEWISGIKENEK